MHYYLNQIGHKYQILPLSDSKKTEWATYRQTLRDIPTAQSTVTDIDNITWPSEPS